MITTFVVYSANYSTARGFFQYKLRLNCSGDGGEGCKSRLAECLKEQTVQLGINLINRLICVLGFSQTAIGHLSFKQYLAAKAERREISWLVVESPFG